MRPLIPDRWRSRRGGGAINPQGNILTQPATNVILTDEFGTIIDDSAPDPACCCGCPPCYDGPITGPLCVCIPQRILVVMSVDMNCECFNNTCPPGGPDYMKSEGQLIGSYCFGVGMPSQYDLACHITSWSGTGCDAPNVLIDERTIVTLIAGVTSTVTGMQVTVNAVTGLSNVFYGSQIFTNCFGPWTLGNELTGNCRQKCDGPLGTATTPTTALGGGFATVYPCAC